MKTPHHGSALVDEACDASHKEQFNLSVRWLIIALLSMKMLLEGLFCLPDTTLFSVVKDILNHCMHFSHRNV